MVESDGVEEALLRVAEGYIQLLRAVHRRLAGGPVLLENGRGAAPRRLPGDDCGAVLDAVKAAGGRVIDEAPPPGQPGNDRRVRPPEGRVRHPDRARPGVTLGGARLRRRPRPPAAGGARGAGPPSTRPTARRSPPGTTGCRSAGPRRWTRRSAGSWRRPAAGVGRAGARPGPGGGAGRGDRGGAARLGPARGPAGAAGPGAAAGAGAAAGGQRDRRPEAHGPHRRPVARGRRREVLRRRLARVPGRARCASRSPTTPTTDTGVLFLDADTLARRADPFAEAGWTIATHAIGDRAIEAVLDAYEKVSAATPGGGASHRARPGAAGRPGQRMAVLGVVACIQPGFAVSRRRRRPAGARPRPGGGRLPLGRPARRRRAGGGRVGLPDRAAGAARRPPAPGHGRRSTGAGRRPRCRSSGPCP